MKTSQKPAQAIPIAPLRIVAMGGGTGLSTLLRGLKRYVPVRDGVSGTQSLVPAIEITAVVTVSDDGGSSGRLRREFDVLPPGDIRNCMVALSEDEALLSQLFQYRFDSGRGLKGHSFGNLFLTALNHLTGDFPKAVLLSSEVLASAGKIFPVTASKVTLEAKLVSGRTVAGESRISKSRSPIARIRLLPARCKPLREVLQAIEQADLITLGPGSLYTSVIPNLLVPGIPEAIQKSRAVKAYFVNLMWQPGETLGFPASEHVEAIYRHGKTPFLDKVIVNTTKFRSALLRKYAEQRAMPVINDVEKLRHMGVDVVGAELAIDRKLIRHDPDATAAIAVALARKSRDEKI